MASTFSTAVAALFPARPQCMRVFGERGLLQRNAALRTAAGKRENGVGKSFGAVPRRRLLSQVALGVFVLGFIDAGYSGDWSRIGVISQENEALLRNATFFVVPLAIWIIFYLSGKEN